MKVRCYLTLGLGVLNTTTTRVIDVHSCWPTETITRKIAEAMEVQPCWYEGWEAQRERNPAEETPRTTGTHISVALHSDVAIIATLFGVIVED